MSVINPPIALLLGTETNDNPAKKAWLLEKRPMYARTLEEALKKYKVLAITFDPDTEKKWKERKNFDEKSEWKMENGKLADLQPTPD